MKNIVIKQLSDIYGNAGSVVITYRDTKGELKAVEKFGKVNNSHDYYIIGKGELISFTPGNLSRVLVEEVEPIPVREYLVKDFQQLDRAIPLLESLIEKLKRHPHEIVKGGLLINEVNGVYTITSDIEIEFDYRKSKEKQLW